MVRPITEVKKIIRETINHLSAQIRVHSVYLFGSYATGSATALSDIDLAVFSPSANQMQLDEKINLISRVQQVIDAGIEIHLFPSSKIKEARPTNFYGYILKTGKKIL